MLSDFDPRQWLDRFTAAGGGYIVTSGGKLVFITAHIDGLSLTASMSELVGHRDRLDAVRQAVEAVYG